MTATSLQKTSLILRGSRRSFSRLTLTLSARGWNAAVEWTTTAAKGRGVTQEEAIDAAVHYAETQWGGKVANA